ncbi:hypothetical protein SNE40_004591 [Patella caerulea]|uniref:K Homology domain-containing protein n=1 Tax=Patella caerulea TaxID=87958 RepID=A0AAN8JYE2_PATCE
MEAPNAYKEELKVELEPLDPNSNAYRLLNKEMERVEKGESETSTTNALPPSSSWLELHHDKPQSVKIQIRIPIKEHPKFNFVGKLLGPKGVTLRRLQEETGTKMSILGRGSMRDKAKEEECRKEGGKFAHLTQDLHLMVEVFAEAVEGYGRLTHALTELKKFMVPDFNDDIRAQQFEQMGYMNNGEKPVRGGYGGRGGPPRGRGGPPGAGGPPAGPPRGGMAGRGAPGPRGAPRGGPPRGAPRGGLPRGGLAGPGRGRGGPPPVQPPPVYDDYGSAGYDDGYGNAAGGYRDQSYDQGYDQGGTQYFDYGHGAGAGSGSGYDYGGESGGWGGNPVPAKPERGRGGKPSYGQRPHPYSRGGY